MFKSTINYGNKRKETINSNISSTWIRQDSYSTASHQCTDKEYLWVKMFKSSKIHLLLIQTLFVLELQISTYTCPVKLSARFLCWSRMSLKNVNILYHKIIIIIITTMIFIVLTSWPGHCESSLGSSGECRAVPSGRRPSDQATWLDLRVRLF